MSPSRGDGGSAEGISGARAALRHLLAELHVLDSLPERSRMLAVDAELPVHSVLSMVLNEQHPQAQLPRSAHIHQGVTEEAPNAGSGGAHMRREGVGSSDDPPSALSSSPSLSCGVVAPSLPSNVLAEVCEFDICAPQGGRPQAESKPPGNGEDGADDRQPALRRQWTSPDDGWGMHLSSIPMQDLEKMPMGMPVTVGELADFLGHACESPIGENGADASLPQRWAEPAGGDSAAKDSNGQPQAPPSADMLEWSLAQWRARRLKLSGQQEVKAEGEEAASRLFVEERSGSAGPVLVHQVPTAPPRPILCTDDPEASLLKAVELLLAYPELDAIPIVSPVRCTVVAHLTLSYCLAYMLPRMRGADLTPLAGVLVGAGSGGAPTVRKFDRHAPKAESWADKRGEAQPPYVLTATQTLRDLLAFFVRTHYSGVPVVEDNGSGGVLGLLSRRDVLNFLDLAMQSSRRCSAEGGEPQLPESDRVEFDLDKPLEAVLTTLRRCRSPSPSAEEASPGVGAALLTEKELTLKVMPLRLLAAENRKLLFVQDRGGGKAPKLLRIVSVSDVWRLLIGSSQDAEGASPVGTGNNEGDLIAQEM